MVFVILVSGPTVIENEDWRLSYLAVTIYRARYSGNVLGVGKKHGSRSAKPTGVTLGKADGVFG
tara:strand:+ start:2573 stop:2764 length:192 start_codon:yes stop_codon:yes gene_type:complete